MKRRCFVPLILLVAAFGLGAENLTTEEIEKHLAENKAFFLDVREPEEIRKLGSVPGYVNIPLNQLEKRMNEIPKDKAVITMCNKGVRAARAADMLSKAGYKVAGSCGLGEYKEKGKKLVYPEGSDAKRKEG